MYSLMRCGKNMQTRRMVKGLFVLAGWLAAAGVMLSFLGWVAGVRHPQYDFGLYYYAFQVVWHHEPARLLYDTAHERAWMAGVGLHSASPFDRYVYPPQFAVLLSGLAALPLRAASVLWTVLSAMSYLIGVYGIQRIACRSQRVWPRVMLFCIAMFYEPYIWDLQVANANWLVFFLVSLAFFLRHRHQNRGWAGIPLGLAACMKVIPVILLLYLALRKEWRMLWSAVLTMAAATCCTWLVAGGDILWRYIRLFPLLTGTTMQNGPAPYNSSLKGVLAWWAREGYISSATANHLFLVYLVAAGVLLLLSARCRPVDERAGIAMAALSMLLLSPLVEVPHLLIALIPLLMEAGIWLDRLEDGTVPVRGKIFPLVAILSVVALLSPLGHVWLHWPGQYFAALLILFGATFWQVVRLPQQVAGKNPSGAVIDISLSDG